MPSSVCRNPTLILYKKPTAYKYKRTGIRELSAISCQLPIGRCHHSIEPENNRFPSPSSPGRAAFVMMGAKGDEEGFSDYRWIVPGQSRPGRVGLHPAIRCNQEGTLRVRRSHYQQSNGVDGGDPGAPRVQGAVRSRNHDRRRVRSARNHAVGDPMETSPLVEEEPPGSQRGPLDGTGRVGRDPQNELDLDQGTRRSRG